jgi:hypothetical protein
MWLITRDGFISLVEYKHDPTMLLARARREDDLLTLVRPDEIQVDRDADYMYRAPVARTRVALWMAKQIDGIDYTSHAKEEMSLWADGTRDTERYEAYMRVWGDLYEGLDERAGRR